MVLSYTRYFLLVQSVYASCMGNADDCKLPTSQGNINEVFSMIQHVGAKVEANNKHGKKNGAREPFVGFALKRSPPKPTQMFVKEASNPYQIVNSGTCEDQGMTTIVEKEACLQAGRSVSGDSSKGFRFDQPANGYTDANNGRTRGCTFHGGNSGNDIQFFPSATGNCGTANFHCICKKEAFATDNDFRHASQHNEESLVSPMDYAASGQCDKCNPCSTLVYSVLCLNCEGISGECTDGSFTPQLEKIAAVKEQRQHEHRVHGLAWSGKKVTGQHSLSNWKSGEKEFRRNVEIAKSNQGKINHWQFLMADL